MKEYFKNALIICAEMTLLVVCWGLAEFALAVLRIEIKMTLAALNEKRERMIKNGAEK